MILRAPAKVNLGLRITGRRPDGYHELESIFVPLDLADTVSVEVSDAASPVVDFALAASVGEVPEGPGNLAARAAQAFLAAAGVTRRVAVRLEKQIPAGAGLGGGSSDAGAVLRGLSELLPGALSAPALEALALELGADVPYFLAPRPALVTGVGECREVLSGFPHQVLLLANPGEALATARVYAAFDALSPAPCSPGLRGLLAGGFDRGKAPGLPAEMLHNDLETAAVGLCPAVAQLRDALAGVGAGAVALTGSGATVFGVFPGMREAQAALGEVRARTPDRTWLRFARTLEDG